MGFSKQEYWSGLPCPPPGDLPTSGIKPVSLISLIIISYLNPALAAGFFTTTITWEACATVHGGRKELDKTVTEQKQTSYMCFQTIEIKQDLSFQNYQKDPERHMAIFLI